MRMGLRRSLTRDSAMSMDSLYSSLASSCRRKWVDFLTLQKESRRGGRESRTVIPHMLGNADDVTPFLSNNVKEDFTCSTGSTAPEWRSRHGSASQSWSDKTEAWMVIKGMTGIYLFHLLLCNSLFVCNFYCVESLSSVTAFYAVFSLKCAYICRFNELFLKNWTF